MLVTWVCDLEAEGNQMANEAAIASVSERPACSRKPCPWKPKSPGTARNLLREPDTGITTDVSACEKSSMTPGLRANRKEGLAVETVYFLCAPKKALCQSVAQT